ncbi:hypothetical protein PM023_07085 [Halorubrum ezzemoulense]|uniref:hypothetical protein n=1 Tax=Halorubrum ezzemoulense TaxID=337243 RepID=UPI00232D543D|nr:hypothetical protein [Halorubrum ezzemoulense]MDB2224434.1 hypothetical protein [Halorubrum ezzemoulense]
MAGDPTERRHTANNPDRAVYLLVGGNRLSDTSQSVGYVDVIKTSGQTTTTINSRTIGTNQTNGRSCPRDDASCGLTFRNADGDVTATPLANVSGFAGATAAARLVRLLVSQRYRLAITDGTLVVDESGIVQPTSALRSRRSATTSRCSPALTWPPTTATATATRSRSPGSRPMGSTRPR